MNLKKGRAAPHLWITCSHWLPAVVDPMLAARLWLTSCDPAMPIDQSFPANRTALTNLLFPAYVPPLWSPTMVFYDETYHIDRGRQLTHLPSWRHTAPAATRLLPVRAWPREGARRGNALRKLQHQPLRRVGEGTGSPTECISAQKH